MCARASAMAARSPFWSRRRSAGRSAPARSPQAGGSGTRQSRSRAPPRSPQKPRPRTSARQRQARSVLRAALRGGEGRAHQRARTTPASARPRSRRETTRAAAARTMRGRKTQPGSSEASRKRPQPSAEARKTSAHAGGGQARARSAKQTARKHLPEGGEPEEACPHRQMPATRRARAGAAPRRGAPRARPAHHHQRARRGAAPAVPCLAEAPPGAPEEADHGTAERSAKIQREVIIPEVITIQELANRMAERAVDVIKFLMKRGRRCTRSTT